MNDPNWEAAIKHIEWLTEADDAFVEWQVFDDSKRHPELARRYYASLQDMRSTLTNAQAQGCSVFIAVNETDGQSRRKESVTAYRAVFLDFDGAPLPDEWPIPPGMTICSSPGKYQVWWKLQLGADLEAWTAVHLDLIERFGADPKCVLTTQVGRCAGFMHLKGDPHEVTIIDGPHDAEPVSLEEFAEAFGIDIAESLERHKKRLKPASGEIVEPPCGWDNEADVERAKAWLSDEANWKSTSDSSVSVYDPALRMADLAISPGMAEELITEAVPVAGEHWDEYHIRRKVEHAYQYRKGEIGQNSQALRDHQAEEDRELFMSDEVDDSVIEGLRADSLKRVGRRRRIKVPLDFSTEATGEPLDFSSEVADEPLDFSDTDEDQS